MNLKTMGRFWWFWIALEAKQNEYFSSSFNIGDNGRLFDLGNVFIE